MQSVSCDLTGETIKGGMPNFGRGVHNFVINADRDLSVNLTFQGTGNGVIPDAGRPQGIWSGQSTGGVNLSKAGLAAALLAAQTIANVLTPSVSSAQSTGNNTLAHTCDLTDTEIAAGTRNFGRGTIQVNVGQGVTMNATFFRGNSGGVDLSEAGFVAAMAAAAAKVSGISANRASGTLTMTGAGVNNETITIAGRAYTLKTTLTGAANEVLLGANQTATMTNLARAINNGVGGIGEGSLYGTGTVAHATVTAEDEGPTLIVTAKAGGTGGNALATTETLTNGSFGGATLAGGTAITEGGVVSGNHIPSIGPMAMPVEAPGVSRPD